MGLTDGCKLFFGYSKLPPQGRTLKVIPQRYPKLTYFLKITFPSIGKSLKEKKLIPLGKALKETILIPLGKSITYPILAPPSGCFWQSGGGFVYINV